MKYQHDYTELDELLSSQFDPKLLAELLEQMHTPVLEYSVDSGQPVEEIREKLKQIKALKEAFNQVSTL